MSFPIIRISAIIELLSPYEYASDKKNAKDVRLIRILPRKTDNESQLKTFIDTLIDLTVISCPYEP
jgi:hypothetical protein